MEIETFNWLTPAGGTCSPAFSVLTASYGDGYRQTAANGLNSRRDTWSLTFTGTEKEMQPIKDFLDRHGAVRSFRWKAPMALTALYKGTYTMAHKGGAVYSLSVSLERDFRP